MRTRVILLAAAATIGAALAGVSLATGSTGGGASAKTIKAVARGAGAITFVDSDHNGKPSLGDYEVGNVVFVNAARKRLGRGSVVCTVASAAGTRSVCYGDEHFAGGDLIEEGEFFSTSKTYRLAIVGGTGVYAGVSGTVDGTWLDARFERSRVAFSLRASY